MIDGDLPRDVAHTATPIAVLVACALTRGTHPLENYENWELIGPGDLNLVGLPGGGDPRISGALGK